MRKLRATLVIAAHNAMATLPSVLHGMSGLSRDIEIITVDDHSTDRTFDFMVDQLPRVRAFRNDGARGASCSRNFGATQALAPILIFLDSDVVVSTDLLEKMVETVEQDPTLAGLFGCYAPACCHREESISCFRNLLHRCFHVSHGSGPVSSFWTGIGAVRTEAFRKVHGFHPKVSGIEDVEFGKRLCDAGYSVRLDTRFQGIHLKRWNWKSFLSTDILLRSSPWIQLGLQGRVPLTGLNLAPRFALGPIIMGLALPLVALWPRGLGYVFVLYLLANLSIYQFMWKSAGWKVGGKSLLYLAAHHLCCGIGLVIGIANYLQGQRLSVLAPLPVCTFTESAIQSAPCPEADPVIFQAV